jgi:ABC-type multidrug transport system fused ATPase/permease subunit
LDDKDIRDLNVESLRRVIGFVPQEPVLFNRSLAENIAYGDNSRKMIPMEEIIEAAKASNIHNFIEKLPQVLKKHIIKICISYHVIIFILFQGYNTNVGQLRGSYRVDGNAISRALLRSPKMLLLDEITSALDAQSEAEIQQTLDSIIYPTSS